MVEIEDQTEHIMAIKKALILAVERADRRAIDRLTQDLADARAQVTRELEIELLAGEVGNRDRLRKQAERIVEKVQIQGASIDAFLEQVKAIAEPLAELLTQAKALPALQNKTWEQYVIAGSLSSGRNLIPTGYIPEKMTAPILGMKNGTDPANASQGVVHHLMSAMAMLKNFERVEGIIPTRPPTEYESIEEPPKNKKS